MSLCSSVMLYSKTSLQTIAAWSASTGCKCDKVTYVAVLFILADQSMTGLCETNGHIHTQFCMIPGFWTTEWVWHTSQQIWQVKKD